MLVSGGQILAIDKIYTDGTTLVGDGVQKPAAVNTEVIATTKLVSGTSAELQSKIDDINDKFDDYYKKTETSSKEEISNAFENFKTNQTVVSAGSDKVSVDAIPSGDKTIIYKIDVTPGAVSIAGTSGISAKQVNDTWILGLSANFLSANALEDYYNKNTINGKFVDVSAWAKETFASASQLEEYYKKTETSSKNEIQTALDQKQNVSDMSAYAQSAWVNDNYQKKGDYVTSAGNELAGKTLALKDNQWIEFSAADWTDKIAEASAAAVNSAVNTVKNKFDLTEDNKISGYDNIPFYHQSLEGYATEEFVNTKIDETTSWADETFQKKGEYVSATEFDDYKDEVEQKFVDTSAWAEDTFQKKGDYLSANALDDISGKWESVYDTVNAASGDWNEASAFAANSGKFVTSAGVEFDPALAYFLKKDEATEGVSWSGVDLTNLGKMYDISSITPDLISAGISADENNNPIYVLSAAKSEEVATPSIEGDGLSAWKDPDLNKYFVSANIVGNHGVSAGYDTNTNTWNVGISANEYAYYSNTYENNDGESVDTDTIIKFVGGIARDISVDADGYITLPNNGNKFTVCVNETVSDNIDSNAHAYLSNRIQLCSKRSNSAETVLVSTNNYYATEVGASDATIAYTLTNSLNTKYFIKYAGSKIDVSKNANAKLHIVISILEEVSSLATTEGGGERYTGIEPIFVEDVSNKIGLAFDREQFQITPGTDPDHPSLSALQINIQTTGGNIDQEAFEKLANIINGRLTETIPIGLVNSYESLGDGGAFSYLFRPTMEFDVNSGTKARIMTHNGTVGTSKAQVAISELNESNSNVTIMWWSEIKTLTAKAGTLTLSANPGCTENRTLYPDRLYYASVINRDQETQYVGFENKFLTDAGAYDIAYWDEHSTNNGRFAGNLPGSLNGIPADNLGQVGDAKLKPYIAFRNED